MLKITKKLIDGLSQRLKIGDRRGVHLNAIPGKTKYKFDIERLSLLNKDIPNDFINSLLINSNLKYDIGFKKNIIDINKFSEEEQLKIIKISKNLNDIKNQTDTIQAEKGINTFGFGYPLLIKRSEQDQKIIVSPILIWQLNIENGKDANSWIIKRNEDSPIYLNEVLINYLKDDSKIDISKLGKEILEDGLIDKDELINICLEIIKKTNGYINSEDIKLEITNNISSPIGIKSKDDYDQLVSDSSNSLIEYGGLFSIFEIQKENIIKEYDQNLKGLINEELEDGDLEDGTFFQPISSIKTDPSQQLILNSLNKKRNIIIQGPPGTGKSQTLTAILINALENDKKVLVVCEKKTAMDVLYEELKKKKIENNSIIIRDLQRDRKDVVDSVRERIGNFDNLYNSSNHKTKLQNKLDNIENLINKINTCHTNVGKIYLNDKNWTQNIGDFLREKKNLDFDFIRNLKSDIGFEYNNTEFVDIKKKMYDAEKIYHLYKSINHKEVINENILIGDKNIFQIKEYIHNILSFYSLSLNNLSELYKKSFEKYLNSKENEIKLALEILLNEINNIKTLSDSIEKEKLSFKKKIIEKREKELNKQNKNIENIFVNLENNFVKNSSNSLIRNKDKMINIFYRVFISKIDKRIHSSVKDFYFVYNLIKELDGNKKHNTLGNIISELDYENNHLSFISFKKVYNSFIENLDSILEKEAEDLLELINKNQEYIGENYYYDEFGDYFIKTFKKIKSLNDKILDSNNNIRKYLLNPNIVESVNSLVNITEDNIEFDLFSKDRLGLLLNIENHLNEIKIKSYRYFNDYINNVRICDLRGDIEFFDEFKNETLNFIEKVKEDSLFYSYSYEQISIIYFINNVDENIKSIKEEINNNIIDIRYNWIIFFNNLDIKSKNIIEMIKEQNNWSGIFSVYYLHNLLLNKANNLLPMDDDNIKLLKESLEDIEKEQVDFLKYLHGSNQKKKTIEYDSNHTDFNVRNIYSKRSGNSRKLSLREIIQKDADLFTTFFPIVFTTPDIASNLFKGMNDYFDFVLFDEASQLRPEDTLPSLLKGKQIIVAGDEQQMPPSSWFQKTLSGQVSDDEDEYDNDLEEDDNISRVDRDDNLLACESLLEFSNELNFYNSSLDFHYRSKHPYLIEFSNYAFYKQKLKSLPPLYSYIPINFIHIEKAIKIKKDNDRRGTNEMEVDKVLEILDKEIKRKENGEYPTVGIATFNIQQRDLIIEKLLDRKGDDKYVEFNKKINELGLDELSSGKGFIKNVDNIQGDEKDIIIISTTFAKDENGRFIQNFGPITQSKGFKILNVLVTRAKEKIYCISSIPMEYVLAYKQYISTEGIKGKAVLYAYLAYCKAVNDNNEEERNRILLALAEKSDKSVSYDNNDETESPFEEEVYQVLVDEFGSDNIIPQVKVGGFRIDLLYNPKGSNIKIAIECDGAKYHSSREAYLYDIHRQKILEQYGYKFVRIWSTNWWQNFNLESQKLIENIKKLSRD